MKLEFKRWRSNAIGLALALATSPSHALLQIDTVGMEERVKSEILATHRNLELNRESADAWGQMGMVLQAHGFNGAALRHYEQAIARNAADYRWPYLAADAISATDPVSAAPFFAKAVASTPDDVALFLAYGNLLTRLGEYAGAQSAFTKALQINNSSSFANIGLGRLALIDGDIAQARLLFERARDQAPRNNEIHTLLSQVYARMGDLDAASNAGWLARAHKYRLQPHARVIFAMAELAVNAEAYERRGYRLADRGDYAGAQLAFRQVLESRTGSPQDLGNVATVLAHLGEYSAAFELFDQSLALDPDNVLLLNAAGWAYLDSGQLQRAAEFLASAAEKAPNYAEVHLNLGLLRAQQGVDLEAIEYLERALTLDPSLSPAYLPLGRAYVAGGKPDAAIAVWHRLLSIERDNVSALRELGFLQMRLGRYDQAITALAHAQGQAQGDSATAIALTRLLATAPNASSRDVPRALAMAMTLFRARPHDPVRIDLLAMTYAANGDFARAAGLAERALANALDNPQLTEVVRARLNLYNAEKTVVLPSDGVRMSYDKVVLAP